MPPLIPLVQHGFMYGLLLTLLLIAVMLVSAHINPAIWVGDYPPDIRAKFGPPDARTQGQKKWVALAFVIAVGAAMGLMVAAMPAAGIALDFATVFATAFLTIFVFNLLDLVILDWLVFVVWHPRFIVLPGTEGMAGYSDLGFHVVGFFKGMVFCVIVGLLTAGATVAITLLGGSLR